jgi:hypothetical protein
MHLVLPLAGLHLAGDELLHIVAVGEEHVSKPSWHPTADHQDWRIHRLVSGGRQLPETYGLMAAAELVAP